MTSGVPFYSSRALYLRAVYYFGKPGSRVSKSRWPQEMTKRVRLEHLASELATGVETKLFGGPWGWLAAFSEVLQDEVCYCTLKRFFSVGNK